MNDNDTFKKYLIEEFYDDYREGLITRRTFIRRVAFITGSMAATVVAMSAAGCRPVELPAATEPMPEAATPAAAAEATADAGTQAGAVPGAKSPLSVPEGDPAVQAVHRDLSRAEATRSPATLRARRRRVFIPPS